MGQKVNPNGLRVGVIKNWDSRWFAKDNVFGDLLVEDYEIRKDLKKRLYDAGVPAIEIERKNDEIKIMIQCARPGMVVGRGGEDIKKLEEELTKKYGKKVRCSIIEIKNPDTNATLVAENIAAQLEKRIGFRRAMKQSMGRAMRMGAKGIKVSCGGRLAARKSHAPSITTRAPFRCRPCVRTSTMVLLKLRPPTAASVLRYGSTRVRFSTAVRVWVAPLKLRSRHSSAAIVAVTVAAVVTSTVASVVLPVRKEATVNAAP